MDILRGLLPKLSINAVPIWGLAFGGWSAPTALAVYWYENLIGSLLVALRIAIHRRVTHKRGHYRAQLGTEYTVGEKSQHSQTRQFFAEFLVSSLVFTLAHGIFLAFLLSGIFGATPQPDALRLGIIGITTFQLMGFVADMIGIRERPFSWIKRLAQYALGRVVLIHLAIIGGVALGALNQGADAVFLPFAVFKLLADVGNELSRVLRLDGSPEPFVQWIARLRPGSDFAAHMNSEWEQERARMADDEEIGPPQFAGKPPQASQAARQSARRRGRKAKH